MSFLSSTKEGEVVLVFDIGNTSVGGAVVLMRGEGRAPEILEATRLEMPMIESLSAERLLREIDATLEEVSSRLRRTNSHKISSAHAILASPWYASETRVLRIENPKPFVCDESIVKGAIDKEIAEVKKVISSRRSEKNKEIEVIESRIIQMKCNGYEAYHSMGKTITEAEIYLYVGVAPAVAVNKFSESIARFFKEIPIHYHSFPLVYYSVVGDIFPTKTDYLLIDVSGEITDVTIIRRRALLETVSFPLGRNFVFREIGQAFKQSPESVRSLLSPSHRRSADDLSAGKLRDALLTAKKEWLKEFQSVLTRLSWNLYIPEEAFLTADQDMAKTFLSWIGDESLAHFVLSHKKFMVIPISYHNILNTEAHKGKVVYDDHFLLMGALFAGKITGKELVPGVQ